MQELKKSVLTLSEAAEFTGFAKNYLYRLTSQKKIPFHKPLGGRVFFKLDELESFMFGQGGKK